MSSFDFHSPLKYLQNDDDLELDKKITELQLFEGDTVSRVYFEKNQV